MQRTGQAVQLSCLLRQCCVNSVHFNSYSVRRKVAFCFIPHESLSVRVIWRQGDALLLKANKLFLPEGQDGVCRASAAAAQTEKTLKKKGRVCLLQGASTKVSLVRPWKEGDYVQDLLCLVENVFKLENKFAFKAFI